MTKIEGTAPIDHYHVGDAVRFRNRGTIVEIRGNRALVQWASGSRSSFYLRSLEHVEVADRPPTQPGVNTDTAFS